MAKHSRKVSTKRSKRPLRSKYSSRKTMKKTKRQSSRKRTSRKPKKVIRRKSKGSRKLAKKRKPAKSKSSKKSKTKTKTKTHKTIMKGGELPLYEGPQPSWLIEKDNTYVESILKTQPLGTYIVGFYNSSYMLFVRVNIGAGTFKRKLVVKEDGQISLYLKSIEKNIIMNSFLELIDYYNNNKQDRPVNLSGDFDLTPYTDDTPPQVPAAASGASSSNTPTIFTVNRKTNEPIGLTFLNFIQNDVSKRKGLFLKETKGIAEQTGLEAGMRLIKINDENVQKMKPGEVQQKVKDSTGPITINAVLDPTGYIEALTAKIAQREAATQAKESVEEDDSNHHTPEQEGQSKTKYTPDQWAKIETILDKSNLEVISTQDWPKIKKMVVCPFCFELKTKTNMYLFVCEKCVKNKCSNEENMGKLCGNPLTLFSLHYPKGISHKCCLPKAKGELCKVCYFNVVKKDKILDKTEYLELYRGRKDYKRYEIKFNKAIYLESHSQVEIAKDKIGVIYYDYFKPSTNRSFKYKIFFNDYYTGLHEYEINYNDLTLGEAEITRIDTEYKKPGLKIP